MQRLADDRVAARSGLDLSSSLLAHTREDHAHQSLIDSLLQLVNSSSKALVAHVHA